MQLSNFITKVIFTTAFVSTFLAFTISIIFQYKNFQNDKLHVREEFTELKKEQIKREVLSVYNLIEQKEELLINAVKEKLKERVNHAHNLAMTIYNENKELFNTTIYPMGDGMSVSVWKANLLIVYPQRKQTAFITHILHTAAPRS